VQDVETSVLEAFVDGFNLEDLNSKISALQLQDMQVRERQAPLRLQRCFLMPIVIAPNVERTDTFECQW